MKRLSLTIMVFGIAGMVFGGAHSYLDRAEESEKQGNYVQALQHYVSAHFVRVLHADEFEEVLMGIYEKTGSEAYLGVLEQARKSHLDLLRQQGDTARQFIEDIAAIYDWIEGLEI